MNNVRNFFFRYVCVIMCVLGYLVSATIYFIHGMTGGRYEQAFWALVLLFQTGLSTLLGFLIRRLHKQSSRDPLTGMYNRRYFAERLEYELERTKRYSVPLSLIIIDLDKFKSINDNHGHLEGDRVLKAVAKTLDTNSRSVDIVARWGGEEFAILLPHTDIIGAEVVAERLRKTVEELSIGIQITLSAGVASINKFMDMNSFVALSDQAMYEAKKTRNTVVVMKKE